jgi:VanZ family protein
MPHTRSAIMKCGVRLAGVLAVCLVVLLSVIPANLQIRTGAPNAVEHLAAYFVSAVILVQAFGTPVVITFLIGLAGGLEIVQLWVPGRTFDFQDWELSLLGAMLGVVLGRVWNMATTKNEGEADTSLIPRSPRRTPPS